MRMVTIEAAASSASLHTTKTGQASSTYLSKERSPTIEMESKASMGPGWPEDRNTTHWLENRETIPAVEILGQIMSGAAVSPTSTQASAGAH